MKTDVAYIQQYITPKDKTKVAQHNDVDESYINKILRGDREANSKTAQSILRDLHICATINELMEGAKEAELTKAA